MSDSILDSIDLNSDEKIIENDLPQDVDEGVGKTLSKLKNPEKNAKAYGYKYATLDEVREKITSQSDMFAIPYTKIIEKNRTMFHVQVTDLFYKGQLIRRSETLIEPFLDEGSIKNKVQALGSIKTYLRRYQLGELFNLAPEEDDDGASAHQQTQRKYESRNDPPRDRGKPKSISEAQHKFIMTVGQEIFGDPVKTVAWATETVGKSNMLDFTSMEASKLITDLQSKQKRKD